MKKVKIVALALLAFLTLSQLALFAQAGPPGPGGGAPVDGGALLLVLGAAAYGYTQLKKNKETKEEETQL